VSSDGYRECLTGPGGERKGQGEVYVGDSSKTAESGETFTNIQNEKVADDARIEFVGDEKRGGDRIHSGKKKEGITGRLNIRKSQGGKRCWRKSKIRGNNIAGKGNGQ